MGSISGEESKSWGEQEQDAQGEKIFVAVRLRPLNEKEIAKNDTSDWECINNNTIIFRNTLPERSLYPVAYTLGRVYGCDSSTRQVYEEAAKKIALSVINGINASIFAYGQTSSGKTYTMSGVTEYAMADIFDQISKQNNREFVLKFSAIEIYNECVRDLLSADNAPLRLLDDPEKGTVIEKLTEVNLRDWSQLKELLSICEAERQIGETTLNEMSSRSHQILRLTVESSAREFKGHDNASTLAATVNFVDLAGSERASQTLSAGTRLKEGCHINRSLLTLGTVVRKLSKGRNGHIPYRDSKLTRILQHALGGNARTAIICTMSPAHSHVEQSRNTLLFAISAKEISTNAQVNVVMSEKALVKQLQRELARLENEIKILSASSDSAAIIREKELQIQKMEKEIQELNRQRDLAESRLEEIIRIAGIDQNSLPWVDSVHLPRHRDHSSWDGYPTSDTSEVEPRHLSRRRQQTSWDGRLLPDTSEAPDPLRFDYSLNTYRFPDKQGPQTSDDDQYFFDNISPSQFMNQYFGPEPCQGWEKINQKPATTYSEESCKEVRCIEKTSSIDSNVSAEKVHTVDALDSPKQKNEEIHATIDDYDKPYYVEPSPCSSDTHLSDSRSINLTRSTSCRAIITTSSSPASEKEVVTESMTDNGLEREVSERQERHRLTISVSKSESNIEKLKRQDSQKYVETLEEEVLEQTVESKQNQKPKQAIRSKSEANMAKISRQDSLDSIKIVGKKDMEQNINSATGEDIFDLSPTAKSLSKGVKFDNEIVKLAKSNTDKNDNLDDKDWPSMFEKQRRNIIELWNACNIPLLHRTYFFLLFKGDPSDSVYMEVELRRLSFLKKTVSPSSSARSLNHERMMLSKKLQKKFSAKEREDIFVKWGINLESKNRRVQLSHLLWSKTDDIEHATASAEIVAKLVGLLEPNQTPKELFALSFAPKEEAIRSSIWRNSMSFNR